MSQKVYIVLTYSNCDDCTPIKAFEDRGAADRLAGECERYRQTRPVIADTGNPDRDLKDWAAEIAEWNKSHPAGADNCDASTFEVVDVPFVPMSAARHPIDPAGPKRQKAFRKENDV